MSYLKIVERQPLVSGTSNNVELAPLIMTPSTMLAAIVVLIPLNVKNMQGSG